LEDFGQPGADVKELKPGSSGDSGVSLRKRGGIPLCFENYIPI